MGREAGLERDRILRSVTLIDQDCMEVGKNYIAVRFGGSRKVLSTSTLNGGIHQNLRAVFNLDGKPEDGGEIVLEGGTYESDLRYRSRTLLGLSGDVTTGMMTAADMKNAAVVVSRYEELFVTAVVTGGIENNGGRAGDPALWQEEAGVWRSAPPRPEKLSEKSGPELLGTINIMLFVNAGMTDGAMERALVTCTEAKTAAIQELSIPSLYSGGIATGSGTDGTVLVSNMDSSMHLTEAGKHCKLGELVGGSVKEAVREALYRQTGVNAKKQCNVFRRLRRYGIHEQTLWECALGQDLVKPDQKLWFLNSARGWAAKPHMAAWAALEGHLLDERSWEMMEEEEFIRAERDLWKGFFGVWDECSGSILQRIVNILLNECNRCSHIF